MEAIRTKDKLFLAVVVPVALAAAYVYFWRNDAVRHIDALRGEEAALVSVEDFPFERQQAERQLAAANEALAAERKIPMPVAKVKADADDGVAARELAVLEIFRRSHLYVREASSPREGEAAGTPRALGVLKATQVRPSPVCRTYEVVGTYPAVLSALRTFDAREMAVLPACVAMPKPGHWSITLCL